MSRTRVVDPHRLDVAAFAREQAEWSGEFALADMPRLLRDALPTASDDTAAVVCCVARGECRSVPGSEPELRLHLQASTVLQLRCQRCLQPVAVTLDIQPTLRFVQDEAQAERLDQADDEDVLTLDAALDLCELVEDELILALPLVPRHDTCPQPLPMVFEAGEASQSPPQPVAALAVLRRDAGRR